MNTISTVTAYEYDEIMEVWEASIRATHHFLAEDDLQLFKKLGREKYLDAVSLYVIRDERKKILGFMGVSEDMIEMLFIRPEARGTGIGKTLVQFAIEKLKLQKVDVNEQNEQAIGFYLKMGFVVKERSETDSMGKPYPILHLELTKG